MKLSKRAFSLAAAILWGLATSIVATANLYWPDYGGGLLNVLASIYPGYSGEASAKGVMILTGYAALDGLIGGFVFACVYNMFAGCCGGSCKTKPAAEA